MAAATIHLIDPSASEDDAPALCGATLRPIDTAEPDWTDEREDATCDACTVIHDERAWEQQQDRGYGAEDYAADRAVEVERGIE